MELQKITLETAKLAREKGFDLEVQWSFTDGNDQPDFFDDPENWNEYEDNFSAPTQELLRLWLRKKHNIFLNSITGHDLGTRFQIYYEEKGITYDDLYTNMFDEHEEALDEALIEGLNKINSNNYAMQNLEDLEKNSQKISEAYNDENGNLIRKVDGVEVIQIEEKTERQKRLNNTINLYRMRSK